MGGLSRADAPFHAVIEMPSGGGLGCVDRGARTSVSTAEFVMSGASRLYICASMLTGYRPFLLSGGGIEP